MELPIEIIEEIYEQADIITKAQFAITCKYFKNKWKRSLLGITYTLKFRYNVWTKKLDLKQEISVTKNIRSEKSELWYEFTKKYHEKYTQEQIWRLVKTFKIKENLIGNAKYSDKGQRININIQYLPTKINPEITCTRPIERHIKTLK